MQSFSLIGLALGGLFLILPASTAPVPLQNATATFSQTIAGDFSVANTLSNATGSSWAIYGSGAGNTAAQTAVFETQTDLGFTGGVLLTFTLAHTHSSGLPTRPNIGRFRLSYTTDDRSLFADGLKTGGDVTANWTVLDPAAFASDNGETAVEQGDMSLLVSGATTENSVYTITSPVAVSGITGFRLETMEDPSLPAGGPGRYSNGNFHLSSFSIDSEPIPGPLDFARAAYVKASNPDSNDQFGYSVAISGNTVVVTAISEASAATSVNGDQTDNSLGSAGAAYVFVVDADGCWRQQAYLKASNSAWQDFFGSAVATDGDRIVVGASNVGGRTGAAYVFVRSGETWVEEDILTAAEPDLEDRFGLGVGISGDWIVVGAFREASAAIGINGDATDNTATFAGAAYIFASSAESVGG